METCCSHRCSSLGGIVHSVSLRCVCCAFYVVQVRHRIAEQVRMQHQYQSGLPLNDRLLLTTNGQRCADGETKNLKVTGKQNPWFSFEQLSHIGTRRLKPPTPHPHRIRPQPETTVCQCMNTEHVLSAESGPGEPSGSVGSVVVSGGPVTDDRDGFCLIHRFWSTNT